MPGLLSQTLRVQSAGNGQVTLQGAAVLGNNELTPTLLIPASTTNQLIPIAFTMANLESIFITVDAAVTLKTNSTGSPANTFSLSPTAPFVWQLGSGITNPFTSDVTAWYATTGGTAANFKARVLTL